MLPETVGIDLGKSNQQLVIGGELSATEGRASIQGAKLNFFDRFRQADTPGLRNGRWNYLVIGACSGLALSLRPESQPSLTPLGPTPPGAGVSSSIRPARENLRKRA